MMSSHGVLTCVSTAWTLSTERSGPSADVKGVVRFIDACLEMTLYTSDQPEMAEKDAMTDSLSLSQLHWTPQHSVGVIWRRRLFIMDAKSTGRPCTKQWSRTPVNMGILGRAFLHAPSCSCNCTAFQAQGKAMPV